MRRGIFCQAFYQQNFRCCYYSVILKLASISVPSIIDDFFFHSFPQVCHIFFVVAPYRSLSMIVKAEASFLKFESFALCLGSKAQEPPLQLRLVGFSHPQTLFEGAMETVRFSNELQSKYSTNSCLTDTQATTLPGYAIRNAFNHIH